jgi:hypothetical protein
MNGSALHLAIALEGAGWHPAAWRMEAARPAELLTARYWTDLVHEAERGLVDFVTFEDSLSLRSTAAAGADGGTDRVGGHLDAVLVAARAGSNNCKRPPEPANCLSLLSPTPPPTGCGRTSY